MLSQNRALQRWIDETATLCRPDTVVLCDGSAKEYRSLCHKLVEAGTCIRLNPSLRPRSYAAFSDPEDVARVEEQTFICSQRQEDAGPTNNWRPPEEMKQLLRSLFKNCMQGRTLYVIPYLMGPYGSPLARIGVQLTDSPYAAANMHLMTRTGNKVLELLRDGPFVPCLHSVGAPLAPGQKDVPWPCNTTHTYIVHFPEERAVWSYGSGYGGNALLGKKCFALRLASVMGRDEGWLAEHMLILGLTSPEGEKKYFAASFPSACGKTNLAMLTPTLPGWKVETVGDDIAWMKFDAQGILRAINPEYGFFGVAPGTSIHSNPNAMRTIEKNSIFTNVSLTDDLDVWWEGMTPEPPSHLISWRKKEWHPGTGEKAAHPNARFTAPIAQCPVLDPAWDDPQGVPISALIFGSRRSSMIPLVRESFDWRNGVFMGASILSETTAAASGELGKLRHDPFAMLPFCGYNMGDYFAHWLSFGKKKGLALPKIFYVNWFLKGQDGKYLWPGFGENCRVLKWMFERVAGKVGAAESPIGQLPEKETFDLSGLDLPADIFEKLFQIDRPGWSKELEQLETYFARFENHLPSSLTDELQEMKKRLSQSQ